ncbi:hypothetical protein [Thiocapsa marina]|nr:hypothetical protein [Thiocapsa marina]
MVLLSAFPGGYAFCDGSDTRLLIDVAPAGIRIDVAARPLWAVAEALQSRSGIRVDVEARVRNDSIDGVVEAESWPQILEKLLDRYNKVVVSRDDGSIERVLILNHGSDEAPAFAAEPASQGDGVPPRVPLPPGETGVTGEPTVDPPDAWTETTPAASDPDGPAEMPQPPEPAQYRRPSGVSGSRTTDGSNMPPLLPPDALAPPPPSPSMAEVVSGPIQDRLGVTNTTPIDVAPPAPSALDMDNP